MKRIGYLLSIGVLALSPVALAERAKVASVEGTKAASEALTVEAIVQRHIAALGGEKLLREGKSFTFTVSGEKLGKKFTKTVIQARPDLMRVDFASDDGPMSKAFDGKVAWLKKGSAPAEKMSDADTESMKSHAVFEEPLLDYAKKGTKVKLVGKSEVAKTAVYDLEVTFKSGEVEHHYLHAASFLLVKRAWTGKDKDGKAVQMGVRFGDYKDVQGRMINHSVEWESDDGKLHKSTVSKVSFDKPVDAKLFAMPK